jgi:phosphoglycerol transferase MdoB-like AlkP superfamily enzyme
LFDFILDPLATIAQWVGYGIVASFIVGSLFILIAIPIAIKITAVAVARTVIVETANLLTQSGALAQMSNAVNSVTVAANQMTKQMEQNKNAQQFRIIETENERVM